jgi:hypothetical protein
MLRKRREVQRRRRVALARLDEVITPEPWARGTPRERLRATLATIAPAFGRRR